MKKVLLVEDHQHISLAIGMSLKAMGYAVVTASDAVTAVSHARKSIPDVIVLDINLPDADGFIVAERLHQLVETSAVPIIFITASKQEHLRKRARQLGVANFLEKPFGVRDLADAIESSFPGASGPVCEFRAG